MRVRVREAYGRLSATDWMDVEFGKRLVRWGVGYGFAPAGVLDPPRLATDPTDRLGVNEGRPMGRVDLFRGDTSLTLAADGVSSRVAAARLRTVLAGGVEVAVIAAPRQATARRGAAPSPTSSASSWSGMPKSSSRTPQARARSAPWPARNAPSAA